MSKLAMAYAMKKRMAKGGDVRKDDLVVLKEAMSKPALSKEEHEMRGKVVHRTNAEELRNSPRPLKGLAHGGDVEDSMCDRIMKKRMMSEGGMVANDDHAFEYEFDEPNNFDDLSRRDDLEDSETGANSGDELGNETEDHDRSDIVERILRSRMKKDRNPRPA